MQLIFLLWFVTVGTCLQLLAFNSLGFSASGLSQLTRGTGSQQNLLPIANLQSVISADILVKQFEDVVLSGGKSLDFAEVSIRGAFETGSWSESCRGVKSGVVDLLGTGHNHQIHSEAFPIRFWGCQSRDILQHLGKSLLMVLAIFRGGLNRSWNYFNVAIRYSNSAMQPY